MADSYRGMPAAARRAQIVADLQASGFVRVPQLAAVFEVSDVTIRTDLAALESDGTLRRVHGGAVAAGPAREPAFEEALTAASGEKERIGAAAAAMVRSGQSVTLDVGTTTTAVARALLRRDDLEDVVIVTNGLNIALILEEAIAAPGRHATAPAGDGRLPADSVRSGRAGTPGRFSVIVTGGTLRPLQHSLVDPLGSVLLERLATDIAFIGCNGVDPAHGVTNVNLPEAQIKAAMAAGSARTVVVADSSKLGQVHLGRICDLSTVDTLITGSKAGAEAIVGTDSGMEIVEA